ncbi:tRNA lysidine(34) synthetase TilS, partial [bacterium]|nr:tRNA lysidine(34) synthetase TilS [bacterium]
EHEAHTFGVVGSSPTPATKIFLSIPMLIEQVKNTVKARQLLKNGDKVLTCVSGGPDSMALLYLMRELQKDYKIKLAVAHLDHMLRGRQSAGDAAFVKKTAIGLSIPVITEKKDVKRIAGSRRMSAEEAAREVRYDFYRRAAKKTGANKIATGHNADDQAETVLMRILRGAGSTGLSGIPPVRGLIVRPLIQVRRRQIETYLRRHRLRPRQDLTNRELRLLRNRVRRELIPLLEKRYNPNIVETLNRIGRLESEEKAYFQDLSRSLLDTLVKKDLNGKIVLDLSSFADYFNIAGKFLIRELIRSTKGDLRRIGHDHVDLVFRLARDGSVGSRVHLPDGVVVERAAKGLIFRMSLPHPFCRAVELPGKKELTSLGLIWRAELIARGQIPCPPRGRDEFEAFLDWAKLRGPFVLRTRKRGDRFRPLGMNGTRKLSDYLIDRKIPRIQRDEIPLLVGKDGIVWVVGQGIADSCKVTEKTGSVLWVRCSLRSIP